MNGIAEFRFRYYTLYNIKKYTKSIFSEGSGLMKWIFSTVLIFFFVVIPQSSFADEQVKSLPSDLVSPWIEHTPFSKPVAFDEPLIIEVVVTDDVGVNDVTLFYRMKGDQVYRSLLMAQLPENTYRATIPADQVVESSIEYYIRASDLAGNVVLRGINFSPLALEVELSAPARVSSAASDNTGNVGEASSPSSSPVKRASTKKNKKWVWAALLVGAVAVAAVAGSGGGGGGGDGGGSGAPQPTGTLIISAPAINTP